MITIEQLKDVKERTAALERYLDIEGKKDSFVHRLRVFGTMPRKRKRR